VEGTLKVCVDRSGVVYDVTTERSTGDEAYDKMLRIQVRTWRYVPVVRQGTPTPFCYGLNLHLEESEER
jgi:TonB family protein